MKRQLAISCLFFLTMPGAVFGTAAMVIDPDTPIPKSPVVQAEQLYDVPNVQLEVHKVNKMALAVTNNGNYGTGYYRYHAIDPETGVRAFSCEYPIHSHADYLSVGSLWVGAIVGMDTLVSTGAAMYHYVVELWPDAGEKGQMIRRSSMPHSLYYSPYAVSEEDILACYADTFVQPGWIRIDPIDNRPHMPLNIEVKQRTFAWSHNYAEDFVLFDFEIKNIGRFPLKDMFIGFVVLPTVYHDSKVEYGNRYTWLDDICGFKDVFESPVWPGYKDTLNVAWAADNDGDPFWEEFNYTSTPHVMATRIIRPRGDSLQLSYNWWITDYRTTANDWGPRQITIHKPYRDFGPLFGSPLGDKNKYYIMSTPEIDYDQLECAVLHTHEGWMQPPKNADDYADGHNPTYLLSTGPFQLAPNEVVPVTMAHVFGENFHRNGYDFRTSFYPYNPKNYQEKLDYSDLGLNALWAEWIYDNPGFDSNGDGDSGLARWFYSPDGKDSTYDYYRGDGVPDFRGAAAPPPPKLRVTTDKGRIILRWNGEETENFVDPFSKHKDFEGYKVYYGEDDRHTDFVLLRTYDRRDYNLYYWDVLRRRWDMNPEPVSYDSLLKVFGEGFEPDLYTEKNPLPPDNPRNPYPEYIYFTPQHWNESDLSNPYGIHKIYPDASLDNPDDSTAWGHRFYEYEYIFRDLPAGRPFYVAVTAHDYGSRKYRLSSLETSPLTTATLAWPETPSETVEREGLDVYVYPNPYRIDAVYSMIGFENRDRTRSAERARTIHFANLPSVCKIRIYTVGGDLVQEIDHYYPGGGPEAMHEIWNLMSKNTQAVVTGIYIWEVKSEMGQQLGKLVIIK
jgi:hypothetical protein